MRLTLQDEPRAWRRFTLSTLPAPALLGLILAWKGVLPAPGLAVWLGALLTLLGLCLARPRWFRGFYRIGMTAGFHLTRALGWVVLSLIFLLVITPLGLVLRMVGHDPLQLRRNPSTRTYWRPTREQNDLERMF